MAAPKAKQRRSRRRARKSESAFARCSLSFVSHARLLQHLLLPLPFSTWKLRAGGKARPHYTFPLTQDSKPLRIAMTSADISVSFGVRLRFAIVAIVEASHTNSNHRIPARMMKLSIALTSLLVGSAAAWNSMTMKTGECVRKM